MKKSLLLLSLTVFTLATAMQAQKAYTLKFNPPAGSQYQVSVASKSQMIQNVMDQNREMNMDYDFNSTYKIATEGQHKKLTLVYDQFSMTMQVMGEQVKMSSNDTDTSNEVSAAFRALKGKSLSLLMDEYGKVLEIDGAAELLGAIGGSDQQQEAMKGVVGEDALKTMMEQSFGFYPKNAVRPGDSWTTTMNLKQPFSISGSSKYTLDKVEGNKAYISFAGELATDSSSSINRLGVAVNFDIEGTFTGSSEVDLDTGMPLNTTIQQKMKGNIESGGQKVPMAVNSNVTMTTAQKQ